jgi:hypothetical protein
MRFANGWMFRRFKRYVEAYAVGTQTITAGALAGK